MLTYILIGICLETLRIVLEIPESNFIEACQDEPIDGAVHFLFGVAIWPIIGLAFIYSLINYWLQKFNL